LAVSIIKSKELSEKVKLMVFRRAPKKTIWLVEV
jgi:hypothetical protein